MCVSTETGETQERSADMQLERDGDVGNVNDGIDGGFMISSCCCDLSGDDVVDGACGMGVDMVVVVVVVVVIMGVVCAKYCDIVCNKLAILGLLGLVTLLLPCRASIVVNVR